MKECSLNLKVIALTDGKKEMIPRIIRDNFLILDCKTVKMNKYNSIDFIYYINRYDLIINCSYLNAYNILFHNKKVIRFEWNSNQKYFNILKNKKIPTISFIPKYNYFEFKRFYNCRTYGGFIEQLERYYKNKPPKLTFYQIKNYFKNLLKRRRK
jgi:hypothetical protein